MECSFGVGSPMIDQDSSNLFEVPNSTGSPERRLILAVLERAILDFVGNDLREVQEAEEWLFGERDTPTNAPFSFAWVCRELDLDSRVIAEQIRAMPKRGESRIAPWYQRDAHHDKRGSLRKDSRDNAPLPKGKLKIFSNKTAGASSELTERKVLLAEVPTPRQRRLTRTPRRKGDDRMCVNY